MKTAGIVILILGFIMTVFTAFTFFTREKVADVGKVHISKSEPHKLNWSPLFGIAVMGVGGVILIVSSKK